MIAAASDVVIRALDPARDLAAVVGCYARSADYWTLAERGSPDPGLAAQFFTMCPPGCDPAQSHRLGLFEGGHLRGLAELSFGFPALGDAYLGVQVLAVEARGRGLGRLLLAEVEVRARAAGAAWLYLAVLAENPRGWAFWAREGFEDTGFSRVDVETGHVLHRLRKAL